MEQGKVLMQDSEKLTRRERVHDTSANVAIISSLSRTPLLVAPHSQPSSQGLSSTHRKDAGNEVATP